MDMERFRKYKLGMRNFKTGLSVSLSMLLAQLLNLRSPIFAVIGAIMSMKASVSESFIMGKNRMLGTLVGAALGLLLSYIFPQNAIFLGLGIILVIYVHNLFGWKKSISLSTIVFSVIFINTTSSRLPYALHRILDTFVGITVSMVVNYFIASPNKESMFLEGIENIYQDSREIVYNLVRGKSIDIEDIKDIIHKSELEYEALKLDIDMNFYSPESESNVNTIFVLLDDIYNNISTLSKIKMDPTPILTLENIELMQELYSLAMLSDFDYELEDKDIVYNYHLNELLNSLLQIEDLLNMEA